MRKLAFYLFVLGTIAVAMASCNKSVDDPFTPPEPFYVAFEIDGVEKRYEDAKNNYGNGPGINSYPDSAGILHSQFTTFIRSAADPDFENDIFTVQMVKFINDTNPVDYSTSFLLFDEGAYNYGSWSEDSTHLGIDGAVITYTDSVGKVWSSDQLYGTQQPWASFGISKHRPVIEELYGAETTGTFDCRVFDGSGEHLDLRNGRFNARTIYQPE